MGRQSSRIYFQGLDHKDIYFQGHYHDKMIDGRILKQGGTLEEATIWEKLDGEMDLRYTYEELKYPFRVNGRLDYDDDYTGKTYYYSGQGLITENYIYIIFLRQRYSYTYYDYGYRYDRGHDVDVFVYRSSDPIKGFELHKIFVVQNENIFNQSSGGYDIKQNIWIDFNSLTYDWDDHKIYWRVRYGDNSGLFANMLYTYMRFDEEFENRKYFTHSRQNSLDPYADVKTTKSIYSDLGGSWAWRPPLNDLLNLPYGYKVSGGYYIDRNNYGHPTMVSPNVVETQEIDDMAFGTVDAIKDYYINEPFNHKLAIVQDYNGNAKYLVKANELFCDLDMLTSLPNIAPLKYTITSSSQKDLIGRKLDYIDGKQCTVYSKIERDGNEAKLTNLGNLPSSFNNNGSILWKNNRYVPNLQSAYAGRSMAGTLGDLKTGVVQPQRVFDVSVHSDNTRIHPLFGVTNIGEYSLNPNNFYFKDAWYRMSADPNYEVLRVSKIDIAPKSKIKEDK